MKLAEFLESKENHAHCVHCPHIFLLAPEWTPAAQLGNHSAETFNALNTTIHLMACHPEEFKKDTALVEEIKEWIDVEL